MMSTENLMSPTVAKIAEALAAAQGEMSGAKKGSANPFFASRYADLAAVIGAIREPLASHGIAHVQVPGSDEIGVYVDTVLMHASGEWIKGRIYMNPPDVFHKESREWVSGDTPQGRGSVISYMRRYALQSMCGLEAEDDDGEKGMRRDATPRPRALPPTKPLPEGSYQDALKASPPPTPPATAPESYESRPQDQMTTTWRDVVIHIGKKGGPVNGKKLGAVAEKTEYLKFIRENLTKIAVPTQRDNLLKAALAMRDAELQPVAAQPELGSAKPNLAALDVKCSEAKIPLVVITKVSRNLGGKAKSFDQIPEDEAGHMVANWNDTLEAIKDEQDNIPIKDEQDNIPIKDEQDNIPM